MRAGAGLARWCDRPFRRVGEEEQRPWPARSPSWGECSEPRALYAFAYGEIAGSLYYALGITAVYALSLTPVVFLVAGVLFALAAATYAEGSATFPEGGGSAAFTRHAFNDLTGFVAGWATVLDYVISISLAALFIPYYTAGAFGEPQAFSSRQALLIAIAIVLGVMAVRIWRRTNIYVGGLIVSVVDLVVQAGLAVLGLVLLLDVDALRAGIDLGVKPTWSALAFSLPLAMIAFTGLEKVTALSRQAERPEQSLPDSIRASAVTVILVYAGVATAAASGFQFTADASAPAGYSSDLTTTWLNAPLLGVVDVMDLPGPVTVVLELTVGLTATAILLLAITTSFSGCARLADGMGEHLQLPRVFALRSRRTLLPTGAFAGVGAMAVAFLVVGGMFEEEEVLTLASLYSFGILIALVLAQTSLVWLRITEPDLPRPFTMRGNLPVRGRSIPLPAVAGAAGCFAVWVIALGTHPGARIVGVLWMLGGLAMYAAVRIRAGQPLLSRIEPALPAVEMELGQGAVVVPLERLDQATEEVMATACRLAAVSEARLVGVTAIRIPVRDPLDAPASDREREVIRVQEMAEALALDYGLRYDGVVARTRDPGRLIVDVATEHDADLILLGAEEKRRLARTREEKLFGHTADFVLRKAPCRVIVTHFPAESELPEEIGVQTPV